MLNPAVVYMLISVVLFAVALVVHYHAAHLSLPISPAISITASILPIAALLNAYIYPSLLQTSRRSSSRLDHLNPIFWQALQGIVTVVLATLLFEGVVPSAALNCILENEWTTLFTAHDESSIRQIQDTYSCCGFNSLKDRAFPFPHDGQPSTCTQTYNRDVACKGPWRAALQATAGIDLGVVLATGLLQIIGLFLMRENTGWWTASRTQERNWFLTHRELSQPLLDDPEEVQEAETESIEPSLRSYGTRGEIEPAPTGHRVEPSPLSEQNAWSGP